jgi:hypothetical protein
MACESNTHIKRKNEAEWQEGNSRGEKDSVARKHLVIKMPEGDLNLAKRGNKMMDNHQNADSEEE